MIWARNVAHVVEGRKAYRVLVRDPAGKKQLGRLNE
jgi:hypothetical protein